MTDDDELDLRNFGGQKKKRTAFAQSDTGKQLMTALIDAVRREESAGTVERFPHHKFRTLLFSGNICGGCTVQDTYTGELLRFVCDAVLLPQAGRMAYSVIRPALLPIPEKSPQNCSVWVFRWQILK